MASRAITPAERFKQLLRETASQLRCKASDPRVEHVSTLKLMREAIQARLLDGQRVEPSEVLKLDEALRAYMPTGEAHTIRLQWAQNVVGYCPKCRERIDPYVAPEAPRVAARQWIKRHLKSRLRPR